ncbi:hypothetical protein F4778DRAFT_783923 [Xylariomycetidae sp. FL2044]|nr:hypothetical protein F4778DRAFT_783923 [Xylariomycetidae sp. FL2044]
MPRRMQTSQAGSSSPRREKKPVEPRPSASIVLLSPENQVLLLRRVRTSSTFASAHVFPGGNLSGFHDGVIPPPEDPRRHEDFLAYRLAAIRETFEESGILLARHGDTDGPLLNLPNAERDSARKAIYENKVNFVEWLESLGGIPDTENLLPCTRWITPGDRSTRFTTQMYIYMLPLTVSDDPAISAAQHEAMIPTPDGGAEIMSARFDEAANWLERQRRDKAILFPPQYFLLSLMSQFMTGPPKGSSSPSEAMEHYRGQREKLRGFLDTVPTATETKAVRHHTSQIPWADKAISPVVLGIMPGDKRTILGLDKPGPELKGSKRGGDWERVVLADFRKGSVKNVEIRNREQVLAHVREAEKDRSETKL